MTGRMAEIRFPLRGRQARRDAHASTSSDSADPLQEMAAQIRELDRAAEQAAERIAAAAASMREREAAAGSATRADLLAGLASALVDRTEEIRSDCGRLSALMERTATLIAERDLRQGTEAEPGGEPAPEPVQPPMEAVREPEVEALEPAPEPESEPASPATEPASVPPPPLPPPPAVSEDQGEIADPTFVDGDANGDGDDPGPLPGAASGVRPRWLTRRQEQAAQTTSGGTSEGVRLIATQMAIAGSTRSQIERRLRIQFGVADADQALDEIFGTRRSEVG
jgi:hypothetical protein